MDRPSYYSIIPASVRHDKSLSANAKLLYGEITALCNKDGRCWATNDYFGKLYDVDKKTISKWVQQLADAGHVKTKIQFKKGTKEVEKRVIKIATPIHEKVEENNTSNEYYKYNKGGKPLLYEKKEIDNLFFNACKAVWFKHHPEWQFSGKDGAGIKSIIKKLNSWQKTAGKEVTPETTAAAFDFILSHQAVKGNSFLSTACPSTLSGKLNSIYETLKNKPHGKQQPFTGNNATQRVNDYWTNNPFE